MLFKLKFRLRVVLTPQLGTYEIQYAYYRLFVRWRTLMAWKYDMYNVRKTSRLSKALNYRQETEELAATLRTIEDVRAYESLQRALRDKYQQKIEADEKLSNSYEIKVFV